MEANTNETTERMAAVWGFPNSLILMKKQYWGYYQGIIFRNNERSV